MTAEYFESAEVSDVGRKRKNNEDACVRIPEKGIFCVADGMGGQAGGDLASEAITTTLQDVFSKATPEEAGTLSRRIKLFRKAANQASKWIKTFADEKVIGQMGSTVVALIVDPHNPARAVALHAGDSRLYRYRKGELKQLTSDHSAVEALAAKLGIDPSAVPAKYQNELTRAVGLSELVELEKTPVEVLSGDLFLICSDGLTKMLPDGDIAKFLKSGAQDPIATIAQTLINAANEAGGKDNVTAVLVKAGDISGAPNVIDPDEDDESKTLAVTVSAAAGDAPSPAHAPGESSQIPDTADAYQGNTPQTDDLTPDKTPIPVPAIKRSPDTSDGKRVAKNVSEASGKKNVWLGIVIAAGVIGAAAAGIFFANQSKLKTKPPGAGAAPKPVVVANNPAPQNSTANQAAGQAQTKAAYDAAMKNAQDAFNSHNYVSVVEWAAAALQKLPDDAVATKLRDDAQKVIDQYQEDFQQAQAAYQKGDYAGAIASADQALAIYKDDETVQKLKTDAQSQMKVQNDYRDAMNHAQAAYGNHDFKNAAAWANVALQKIPNAPAATKLRDEAQRQSATVENLEQKYQASLQGGREAMKSGNFAVATAQAKEALTLKPGDPAATQLAAQIQTASDLESARKFFDRGDYDAVLKVCRAYPGVDAFARLARSSRNEQSALAEATALFNRGDYSFVEHLQSQTYGRKPPAIALYNQAAAEQKILGDLEALKRANSWQAVLNKLNDPALAGLTNKPPFRALAQWAKPLAEQAANQKALAQLNVTFETMLVWFNIKQPKDSYIQTSEARKAKRIDGGIDETQRDKYLKMLDQLESSYKKGGWLNQNSRAKYIAELRDTIIHHE